MQTPPAILGHPGSHFGASWWPFWIIEVLIEQMIKSPLTPKSNISVQFQQPPTVLRRSERTRNPPRKLNDYVTN